MMERPIMSPTNLVTPWDKSYQYLILSRIRFLRLYHLRFGKSKSTARKVVNYLISKELEFILKCMYLVLATCDDPSIG